MSVDKSAVREDYQRGLSVRSLAAKYGVPKSTVSDWIKRYGWVQEEKPRYGVTIRIPKDTKSDTSSGHPASGQFDPDALPDGYFKLLSGYTMKLLKKADDLLDLDDALAPRDLKSLSSMLLDVRTLLGTLSPLEEEERRIRLDALKRQAQEEQKASAEVTVRFVDDEVEHASS